MGTETQPKFIHIIFINQADKLSDLSQDLGVSGLLLIVCKYIINSFF